MSLRLTPISLLLLLAAQLHAALPPDLDFNPDAGRGEDLVVTLHLADGRPRAFFIDTGASNTVLDKSLVPLMKPRQGKVKMGTWGGTETAQLYDQPPLFDGAIRLRTGSFTAVHDFSQFSELTGRHIDGVLGMDCLGNYCIQLDFASHKLRFIDSRSADKKQWGGAFKLYPIDGDPHRLCIKGDLLGIAGSQSFIDSGDNGDGWLNVAHFKKWHDQPAAPGLSHAPDGVLAGQVYTGITLRNPGVKTDGLGLHFLARHLVTFDFPARMMYLKRTTEGPLPPGRALGATGYLIGLRDMGLLPGWEKSEHGGVHEITHADSQTISITLQKGSGNALYHYTVVNTGPGQWRLRRARRIDPSGAVTEYPVP